MPTPELWSAIDLLASIWRGSPTVSGFAKELPSNAGQGSRGLPGAIQTMGAGGVGVFSRPLRLSHEVAMYLGQFASSIEESERVGLQEWLGLARTVESAHLWGIAWLRSRMPGYPNFGVPHLVKGSPIATDEYSPRLVWQAGERALGLQARPEPPIDRVVQPLRLAGDAMALGEAYRRVAANLGETTEWESLLTSRERLDDEARERLAALNTELRQALSASAVDAFEPTKAFARYQYREQTLKAATDRLTGPEGDYVRAFDAADRPIELTAGDVFGQLTAYGPPAVRQIGTDLEFETDDHGCQWIRCSALPNDEFWNVGSVAWLDDPILSDAVRVEGASMSFDQVDGMSQRLNCRVLEHTALGLARP